VNKVTSTSLGYPLSVFNKNSTFNILTASITVIFSREGRLWNFGGTRKIHKRFLTENTGSTWVGKEQRDNVETVHTHLF